MRKRIYRISEDKFDDLKPNIEFDQDSIDISCFLGQKLESSFSFRSTNAVVLRGVVYCDNPYVTILDPWFNGESVSVAYSVDIIISKRESL